MPLLRKFIFYDFEAQRVYKLNTIIIIVILLLELKIKGEIFWKKIKNTITKNLKTKRHQ